MERQAVRRHERAAGKVAATAVLASTLPPRYAAPVAESSFNLNDFKIEAEQPSIGIVSFFILSLPVALFLSFPFLLFPFSASVVLVDFADEEGFGKFLDLHSAHTAYINLKGVLVCPLFYHTLNCTGK